MGRRSTNFGFDVCMLLNLGLTLIFSELHDVEHAITGYWNINGYFERLCKGADTVTANYVQFWFRRFRSGIFDVKDAPRTGRPVVENVDKITEIIKVDRHGQTLNSDNYCHQLARLKLVTDQKRPELANRRGVVFHQDNARPNTSVVTHQNLWDLGCEVLIHPPYSPDLATSDYTFFSHCKSSSVIRNWDQEKIVKIDY
ncbi:histonelysine Nmethyltransferase SETMARlike [Trichonephila clavipes]|nr:histonelysine Nmethyltransferase SETMARlike [Trichonephila clavipes]